MAYRAYRTTPAASSFFSTGSFTPFLLPSSHRTRSPVSTRARSFSGGVTETPTAVQAAERAVDRLLSRGRESVCRRKLKGTEAKRNKKCTNSGH